MLNFMEPTSSKKNSSIVTCYGRLEIVENRSGDQSGSVSVRFECFENSVGGDRLRMGSPRVIVRSSSNEGVAEEEGWLYINVFSLGNENK